MPRATEVPLLGPEEPLEAAPPGPERQRRRGRGLFVAGLAALGLVAIAGVALDVRPWGPSAADVRDSNTLVLQAAELVTQEKYAEAEEKLLEAVKGGATRMST